ncbi:hypothetical protein J4E91_006870 [Alternaria rosae]|nr:hypothetical protein J4E91_006870 [Alternaria rosae]
MKDFFQSTAGEKLGVDRPPSIVSWGNEKKDDTAKPSWGTEHEKETGWGSKSDSGWQQKNLKEDDKKVWYSTDDDQAGGWNSKDAGWGNPPSSPKQERVDKMNDWAGLNSALATAFNIPLVPEPAPAPEVPWQNQSWSFPANNDAVKTAVQQPAAGPFASVPAPHIPPKPNAPFQRMSNKTLSKYRPNHNHPSLTVPKSPPNFTAKPHWQFPPPPSTSTTKNTLHASSPKDTYIAPAEPRLTIDQKTASTKGIAHAVRAGKAMEYGHVVGRPEYLDRLEKPYAVFRFKYRSEGGLRGLGIYAEGNGGEKGKEKEKVEKLKRVPQDELIAKMLALERRLKAKDDEKDITVGGVGGAEKERRHSKKNGEKEKDRQKQRRSIEKKDAHGNGRVKDFTEQWVERHARDPSARAKSAVAKDVDGKRNKVKDREVAGSWGQNMNEGWGGGGVAW